MKRSLLALLLLTLPALVWADLTGVYQLLDAQQKDAGTLTVQIKDARHIRYDMQGGTHGAASSLLIEDKLYLITAQGEVMDVDMLGALASAVLTPKAKAAPPQAPQLVATGRSETVAGIKGEVWAWREGRHSGEVVLAHDPRARRLGEAMEALGDRMEKALGDAQVTRVYRQLRDAPALREKGVLRAMEAGGGGLRLVRVEEGLLPAERFTLPKKAGATSLPGLPHGLPNLNDPQMQQMLRGLMQSR